MNFSLYNLREKLRKEEIKNFVHYGNENDDLKFNLSINYYKKKFFKNKLDSLDSLIIDGISKEKFNKLL